MAYFEIDQDVRLEWRWRFRGNNHEIVASGEGYKNKTDCKHAVDLLQAHAGAAPVRDLTTKGLLGLPMTHNALASRPVAGGTILGNALSDAMTRAGRRS